MLIALLILNVFYVTYHVIITQKYQTRNTSRKDILDHAEFDRRRVSGSLDNEMRKNLTLSVKERLLKRIHYLREKCNHEKNNKPLNFDKLGNFQFPWMYVNHYHKAVYCQIPKVGTSNWLKIFAVLESQINDTSAVNANSIHNVALPMVSYLNNTARNYVMKHYTKFVVVREPFDRALSAYKDKFLVKPGYGRPAFLKLAKAIKEEYGNKSSQSSAKQNAYPNFAEYVKYLVDPLNDRIPSHYSEPRHWQPQTDLCYPCNIRYDYVLRLENIEEESEFILREIGAPSNVHYPDWKTKT
uniref:Carbohydrate sulfotransferase n=1 Tax=Ciona savignyi TaxID=51511 RepID=H2Z9Y6_CIOSA